MYLFIFLTLYIFRAHRAHHQERKIVSVQPLVAVTLSVAVSCAGPTCTRHGHRHRKELCVTLVIYQESLHDSRSTKYIISYLGVYIKMGRGNMGVSMVAVRFLLS